MNERLKEIRTSAGLSMKKFGETIGISDSLVALLEQGKRECTDRTIRDICREFNVNETWLRTGEGEMYLPELDEDARIAALLTEKADAFTDTIKSIAKSYFDMTEEEQKVVQKLFEAIKK